MPRILAIDYGEKRTGIAVTDELQIIASGLTTVKTNELIKFLINYTNKEQVELFIVGQPKQMNNSDSESEKHILSFLKQLEKSLPKIPQISFLHIPFFVFLPKFINFYDSTCCSLRRSCIKKSR